VVVCFHHQYENLQIKHAETFMTDLFVNVTVQVSCNENGKFQINISENTRATALSKMRTIQCRMSFTADSWIA
jgi:hypothetical protein